MVNLSDEMKPKTIEIAVIEKPRRVAKIEANVPYKVDRLLYKRSNSEENPIYQNHPRAIVQIKTDKKSS